MHRQDDITVLVADTAAGDEEAISESLFTLPLKVRSTKTAEGVLKALREEPPELLISELRLPDASGFSLCRSIRSDPETSELPVILVSSWSCEMDRILAFECGADDFVARPFYARELASRTAALLRRERTRREDAAGQPPEGSSEIASTAIPSRARSVRVDGQWIDLTPKELAIVAALAARAGRVCSRRELIELAWPREASPSLRTIDSHVKTLRRKLGHVGRKIATVRGVGYRFTADPALVID